jgi:4-amino-4-deoxy-L-arabinose transferase-like glycosyltransferase
VASTRASNRRAASAPPRLHAGPDALCHFIRHPLTSLISGWRYQAAIWWHRLFYGAVGTPTVLMVGHEFRRHRPRAPARLAEIVYTLLGIVGVYLLAQICVVVTFWAVFQLGRAIVGEQHAAMAVLLMVGIVVMTVWSPDFGPATLGMAYAALLLLHFWRAIGENQRHCWFLLALDLGLLLLTTYAGLILFVCMMIFMITTDRGQAALQTIALWFAAILVAVLLFPT